MNEELDTYNYVYCQICGERKKFLKTHLRNHHDLTVDEYKDKFPGSLTVAPAYTERKSRIMTERNLNDWQKPEYREHMCKVLKENAPTRMRGWQEGSKKYFEEHPEERTRIAVMGGNALIEQHGQKFLTEGKLNSQLFHDIKSKQMHEWLVEKHRDPEWEKRLAEAAVASHKGLVSYETYSGNSVELRSSWELLVYEFLELNGIDFQYEPFSLPYVYNGKQHNYFPDFYVPETNLVIEVKPDCFLDEIYQLKKQSVIDNNYYFFHIGDYEIKHLDLMIPLVQSA